MKKQGGRRHFSMSMRPEEKERYVVFAHQQRMTFSEFARKSCEYVGSRKIRLKDFDLDSPKQ